MISDTNLKLSNDFSHLILGEIDDILKFDLNLKPCKIKSIDIVNSFSHLSEKSDVCFAISDKCIFSTPLPLYNNGNNCYINSSIQSLIPTISKDLFVALRNARKVNSPAIELFNVFLDHLERHSIGWNVLNSIKNLKYFSKNFRSGAQEDAQEFLNGFLDRLRDEFDTIDRYRGINNPIRKTYAPSYDSRFFCTKCNKSNMDTASVQEELTFFLELGDSLQSMLTMALRSQNTNYTCEYCKTTNGCARMDGVFTSLPRTFICCVKRFKHGLFSGTKMHREVPLPRSVHLPHIDPWSKRRVMVNYELSSVVIHLGNTINSGHYECVSRLRGQWYRISDSHVSAINELQVQMSARTTSYIYIFTRGPPSISAHHGPIHSHGALKRKWSVDSGRKTHPRPKQHQHQYWRPCTPIKRLLTASTTVQNASRVILQNS